MNVSILGPSYPYRGGIVHFNAKLVSEVSKLEGVRLQVLSWKRLYPTIFLPKPEKDFQDMSSKEKFALEDEYKMLDYIYPWTWWRLLLLVRRSKADKFITHWQQPIHFPIYLVIFILLKLFTKTKIYVVAHNVKNHEASWIGNFMFVVIAKFADIIVTHSTSEYKQAKRVVRSEKCVKAFLPSFNIFKIEKFNSREFKKRYKLHKKVLLFFGFIRPYKGLEYLIEAIQLVKNKIPDLSLIIAGELFWQSNKGKQVKSLLDKIKGLPYKFLSLLTIRKSKVNEYNPLKLIQKYDLSKRIVVFDEYIPNEEVYRYFKVSDALVAPYVSVTQSGPIQVAYHFNKPVLASSIEGLREVVEEGKSGLLFKSRNAKAIADAIEKFYGMKTDWEENVSKYKKRFAWKRYINVAFGLR